MIEETYTIYVCGPWKPNDLNKKASCVLGFDENGDGVLFRFTDMYLGNIFYKNGIILVIMDYGMKYSL